VLRLFRLVPATIVGLIYEGVPPGKRGTFGVYLPDATLYNTGVGVRSAGSSEVKLEHEVVRPRFPQRQV